MTTTARDLARAKAFEDLKTCFGEGVEAMAGFGEALRDLAQHYEKGPALIGYNGTGLEISPSQVPARHHFANRSLSARVIRLVFRLTGGRVLL